MKRTQSGKEYKKKSRERQSASRWRGIPAFFLCFSLLLSLLMPLTSFGVFDSIPAKADSDDLIKVYQDDTFLGEYEDLAAAFAGMQQEDASYRVVFENAEGVYTIEGDVVLPKAKCITFAGTYVKKDSNWTMSTIKISGDWKCQSDIEADYVDIETKEICASYVLALGSHTLKVGDNMSSGVQNAWIYEMRWRFQIVGAQDSCIEVGFENGRWDVGAIVTDKLILKNGTDVFGRSHAMPTQINQLIAESGTNFTIQLFSGRGNKSDCIRKVEIRKNKTYDEEFCVSVSNTIWAKECLTLGNIYSYQDQNVSFNLIYNISAPNRIHVPTIHTELLGYLSAHVDMKITLRANNDLEQYKYQKKHFLLKSLHIPVEHIQFTETFHNTDLEPYVDEKTGWIMLSKTTMDTPEDDVEREEVLSLNEKNVDEKYYISYELDEETRTATVTGSVLKREGGNYHRDVVIPEYVEKDGIRYSVTTIAPNAFRSSSDVGSIAKFYLSDHVKKISSKSFDSSSVDHLWIGKGVESIDSSDAFWSGMFEIAVDPENPYFMSEFGYLYTKNQDTLLKLTRGVTYDYRIRRFEVPGTVKKIAAYANDYPRFCNDFIYPSGTQIEENAFYLYGVGSDMGFALRAGTAQELTEDFEQLVLESMDTLTPDFPIRQSNVSPSPTASSLPGVSEKPETSMTPAPQVTEAPTLAPSITPVITQTPTAAPIQTSDAKPTPTKTPASPSPTASPVVSEKPETSMTPMPSPLKTPAATPTPTSTPTQTSDTEPTKQSNDNSNASNRQPLQTVSPSKQPDPTETIRSQKPALGTITLTKAAYPVISWNKVNTASGYEVWRVIGNKKAFKKLHTVSGKAVCRYIDSQARSGQKYRYRIRAFYKKGGKISYSAYSRIKEIGTYLLKKPLIRGGSGKTADGRSYVWISLKRYAGNRIQIYYRIKKRKWIRLKLVTDRIPKKNSRFMILCKRKYKSYDFQVRTHEERKGKKQYSPLSNVTRIFMEKKE